MEPALTAGEVVVCDRYLPSSLVLQVLDGVAPRTVWALNEGVRVPHLAVFLRADADILTEQVLTRGAHNRFERVADFAVRELALFATVAEELAEQGWPVRVIDCTRLSLPETASAGHAGSG
ncbi:hypothetical protein [Nocardia takedensis]|uniref:hypothetical protein n=1 Tax=Nocardia takedensis TaxID=259390 RepID=UPI002478B8AF|nr:hypothetical protein [Nocardia takedensis]